MLLPPSCPVCGAPGPAPCPACWARLRPAPPARPPAGLDTCRSLLAYDEAGRELLARLKYRNARSSVPWLAAGMAALVVDGGRHLPSVVTWAPTTAARRRQRGFDQAAELAAAVARRLGRPCRRLLHRAPGPPQTGLAAAGRRDGPLFTARVGGRPPPDVLVVDDVVTTGATLTAAAAALRAAGVGRVDAVTAGCTPLKLAAAPADH